ncbi:hypothetical protein BN2475_170018 [Paraburkholderia ribeironis]|uniref:Uncharacterized protein n=1 Tax=Paraburkholderia ribeironis TaxID=1247936 RepID=A0A1N7RUA7_9BURK|nr:hypothetical protein BN2475_170018 [Paraburkholderia ribeironis]
MNPPRREPWGLDNYGSTARRVSGTTIRYGPGRAPAWAVKRPEGACIPRGVSRGDWIFTKHMEK